MRALKGGFGESTLPLPIAQVALAISLSGIKASLCRFGDRVLHRRHWGCHCRLVLAKRFGRSTLRHRMITPSIVHGGLTREATMQRALEFLRLHLGSIGCSAPSLTLL